jgi:predicted DNA-binding antitoxin AbrB/MazE fold protein
MAIEVQATYENGVLRLDRPLPLAEKQRVRVTVHAGTSRAEQSYGLMGWTGSAEELDDFLEHTAFDHVEGHDVLDADFDRVPGLTRYAPA